MARYYIKRRYYGTAADFAEGEYDEAPKKKKSLARKIVGGAAKVGIAAGAAYGTHKGLRAGAKHIAAKRGRKVAAARAKFGAGSAEHKAAKKKGIIGKIAAGYAKHTGKATTKATRFVGRKIGEQVGKAIVRRKEGIKKRAQKGRERTQKYIDKQNSSD